ncbi:Bug family tripartite tricarboxylate transporter substrate binding protein [Polaromonas sp.]|uniref:Bug family tripartite tricarboxylate transporter substrate binding protein n=1 Tax=Polaromonas sp. TaxID=1869339 RepID=UPI002FC747ED
MERRSFLAAALLSAAAGPRAYAQGSWPSKPIRLIVPFAPGGSSEIIARSTAAEMGGMLGQTVYVDNKPGGSGNIAMQECLNASDGHTIILGHIGTLAVNPLLFAKLPFDVNRDFKPISLLAKVPSLYVVNPSVPAKNLKEFVALAKASPGKLNYGSAGNGSAGHLAMEYLKSETGIFMLHVPYRGTGPQMTDLLAGRLEAASVGAAAVMPFIKAGKLRCIATGSRERLPQLPDVATVAEQGYPGFEMTQWYGLMAPSSFSDEQVARLAASAGKAVKAPAAANRFNDEAVFAVGDSPAQFKAFITAEQSRWKKVVSRANIRLD